MKHIKTFESFSTDFQVNEELNLKHKIGKKLGVPASRAAYINEQIEEAEKDESKKESIIEKLFLKYFGDYIEKKGAIKKRLVNVSVEDKMQILKDLAKDSKGVNPVGALTFKSGKLVYVPFEESNLSGGEHTFGAGK